MASFTTSFIFATLFSFGLCGKLPPNFPICKRDDPNLGECVSRAAEKWLPLLKKGIPELQISPIDPIAVDSLSVAAGQGNFKVDQQLSDIKVYGVVASTVNKTDITLEADKFKIVIQEFSPLLKLVSHYDFKGQMLQLPFVGNGKSQTEIIDIQGVITMTGDIISKKGKEYLHLTNLTAKMAPGLVTFQFDNLFNGNKVLGDEMNRLLNENWRPVFEDAGPAYEEAMTLYLTGIVNNIFNDVPFDELFPKS